VPFENAIVLRDRHPLFIPHRAVRLKSVLLDGLLLWWILRHKERLWRRNAATEIFEPKLKWLTCSRTKSTISCNSHEFGLLGTVTA
jgi:hypothetical protein